MSKRGAIGIDIGGTKSLFALFDEKFNVVEEIKLKTNADKGKKVFSEALTGAVEALVDKAHKSGLVLAGAGAGVAGVVSIIRKARSSAVPTCRFSMTIRSRRGWRN